MIEACGLSASVGTFTLHDVTFTVPAGGYGVAIGPAGAGKTTLLETIAGLVSPRTGTLRLNGRDVRGVPPEHRGVGFVYQHGYLFPHLTVAENVAYGAASEATSSEMTQRLEVEPLLGRDVRSLSGGERQLVALARALARRPAILLLDEPFAALDARRRDRVRREVQAIHRDSALTVLHVTHDFAEAGMLGDVAILLDQGRVLQEGVPEQLFRRPASPWVAEFLGAENVFAGVVRVLGDTPASGTGTDAGALEVEFRTGTLVIHGLAVVPDGPANAVIRAEEILVSREEQTSSARNRFRGRITESSTVGALTRLTIDVDGTPVVAAITARSARELDLAVGDNAFASFKAMAVHFC